MTILERNLIVFTRRAAVLASAAMTAAGLLRAGNLAGPDASAAPAANDAATQRDGQRGPRPRVWKSKFDRSRIEPHPNGNDGEYLATFSGGTGSGRCRHKNSVRMLRHSDISRCVDRDQRDISDGHVGARVRNHSYRVLGQDWDDGAGELHLHLRDEARRDRTRARSATDAGFGAAGNTDNSATMCVCPAPFACFLGGGQQALCAAAMPS